MDGNTIFAGKRTISGLEDNIKTKLAYKEYEGMDEQCLVTYRITTNSYIANKNKAFLSHLNIY